MRSVEYDLADNAALDLKRGVVEVIPANKPQKSRRTAAETSSSKIQNVFSSLRFRVIPNTHIVVVFVGRWYTEAGLPWHNGYY